MMKVLKNPLIPLFIFLLSSCTFNVNRHQINNDIDEVPPEEEEDINDDSEPAEPWTIMVSLGLPKTSPDGASDKSFISSDGRYVLFASAATNLIDGDTNGQQDIFIYDLIDKTTEIVSTSSSGTIADGPSSTPSMSADNRYVVFVSTATNLVANDPNGKLGDIFVKDLVTGTTTLVSTSIDGKGANADCKNAHISADGKFVTYSSLATNLAADDTNGIGIEDIFRVELSSLTTIKVNFGSLGQQTGANSFEPFISSDGNLVLFSTFSDALDARDTNGRSDIYMRNINTMTTELISINSAGTAAGNNTSQRPTMSSDGSKVSFSSSATDIVSGLTDTNGFEDIFVRDINTGQTSLVSWKDGNSAPANGGSTYPRISDNGNFIAFQSAATDIITKGLDNNGLGDIFVRDLTLNSSSRVNVSSSGVESNGNVRSNISISGDGSLIGFSSMATNLIAGDDNGLQDIFTRDTLTSKTERVSVAPSTATAGAGKAQGSDISSDGSKIAFISTASNLVTGDENKVADVFLYDVALEKIKRISLGTKGEEANGASNNVRISGDGNYVVYLSSATNLVAGDTNGLQDVFLYSDISGLTTRISVASDGTQADKNSYSASISDDGKYVVFASDSTNLVAGGDTNGRRDIFVHDVQKGTTKRINMALDGSEADGDSDYTAISADGRYVAFSSYATNLIAGDMNGWGDVFVRDTTLNTTVIVSIADDGTTQANDNCILNDMSSDGNVVVYYTNANNLIPGDANAVSDVFVRNISEAKTDLVSIDNTGTSGSGSSYSARISANGRYVVFESGATDLVDDDTNLMTDVFIRDLQDKTTEIASLANDGSLSNQGSTRPSVSNDGLFITFSSVATNLIDSPLNASDNLFLRYRGE